MPHIDWESVARRFGFPDELAMWTDWYCVRRLGINTLALRLQVSRSTIRTALRRCKISFRPVGRPLTDLSALAIRVAQKGISTVAAEDGVRPETVRNRLRRIEKLKREERTSEHAQSASGEEGNEDNEG